MNSLIQNLSLLSQSKKNITNKNTGEKIIDIAPLKALYIPIPKVACSSIKRAIANFLEIEIPNNGMNIHKAHFSFVNKEKLDQYESYWKFCFVRNPWDRLVSCYSEKIKSDKNFFGETGSFVNGVHKGFLKYKIFEANMPFSEFLKAVASIPDQEAEQHFRSQYTFLTDSSENIIADFIGRFERLEKDFIYILDTLNASSALELPQSNKTYHKHYRKYYTDESLALFQARYSKDISLFGYEF
ncbi:sulfotransferase family protein [Acaryochloris sp. CCMEE 5410]|uniref:sulfotransferase family protein n=1 Tax=Acaryochloris sp. CCMEE 5410 TaxID=310037 RepID=UPI0002483B97|nr:sulfotransferase family protein [Acaryochloris sp. CCMEE 5410]KAI9132426.1 sulfotransferase family 2 domain-containing protein [Acaryochloris sp. CCMEE 5410]